MMHQIIESRALIHAIGDGVAIAVDRCVIPATARTGADLGVVRTEVTTIATHRRRARRAKLARADHSDIVQDLILRCRQAVGEMAGADGIIVFIS